MPESATIVRMQFGSHVYGTNVPTSDLDFKAVHLPPARDILLQRVKNAVHISTKQDRTLKNTAEDTDFESFSLQKYMKLLLEGQTIALTMLFTPERWIIEADPVWHEICEQKSLWLHRGVSAFAGYCRQQANKYGIRGSRVAASRAAADWAVGWIAIWGHQKKLKEIWPAVEDLCDRGLEHIAVVDGTHGDG
ncbi:MAG: nucleotidyltransferase domain-containing protein [Planctomycetes bacterium]|nr:nucleotidyltransferase domain-containing protein [Planctomycetota bacterium]